MSITQWNQTHFTLLLVPIIFRIRINITKLAGLCRFKRVQDKTHLALSWVSHRWRVGNAFSPLYHFVHLITRMIIVILDML